MAGWLIWVALQAATTALAPQEATHSASPGSFSILVPVANEPCIPERKRKADPDSRPDDILVCGRPLPQQKLPYPEEVVPDHPVASNPDMTGSGALAAQGVPCSTHMGGCNVGIDLFGAATTLVRLGQKAVSPNSCCEEPGEGNNPMLLLRDVAHGVGKAFAKKPDKSNRVAIALDDPPPPAGRLLP